MSNEVAIKVLNPIQQYIKENNYHKQLNSMLGKRASQFIVSVNNAFEDYLKDCTPVSVMKSAMTAAALDLPIEKNLGFAYLIPYKTECTFQLGYKGLIQLAQRTGQYKTINAIEIYAEQFKGYNPLTEDTSFVKQVSSVPLYQDFRFALRPRLNKILANILKYHDKANY